MNRHLIILLLIPILCFGQLKRSGSRSLGTVGLQRAGSSGVYVPTFKAGLSADSLTGVMVFGDSHTDGATWLKTLMDTLKNRYGNGGSGYIKPSLAAYAWDGIVRTQGGNGWISHKYLNNTFTESYFVNVRNSIQFQRLYGAYDSAFASQPSAGLRYNIVGGDSAIVSSSDYGGLQQLVYLKKGFTYNVRITARSDSATGGSGKVSIFNGSTYPVSIIIPASKLTDSTVSTTFTASVDGIHYMYVAGVSTNACRVVVKRFEITEYAPDNSRFDIAASGISRGINTALNVGNFIRIDSISGTSASIIYARDTVKAHVPIRVNGSFTYLRADSGSFLRKDTTFTGLPSTKYYITFDNSWANDYSPRVFGIYARNSKGIVIDNMARGGFASSEYVGVDTTTFDLTTKLLAPKLVLVMLGTNETNVALATIQSNLTRIATRVKNATPSCDVVIISPIDNGLSGTNTMAQISDACRAAASSSGVQFLDLYARFPKYADAVSQGLMANSSHPNSAGHLVIFGIIKQALGL